MKKGARSKPRAVKAQVTPERGINLDVPGSALIAQTGDRIAWHKRNAAMMAAELKNIPPAAKSPLGLVLDWKQEERRSELTRLVRGHEEYARFLAFVKRHVNGKRTYRLSLQDLSHLEIMPKGSYL